MPTTTGATTARDRTTRSWWTLGRDGWRAVLGATAREFTRDQVPTFAGQVTLRIVLALVPSLIAAVAIAAQLVSPSDIEELVGSAEDLIPGESARAFVQNQLQNALEELQTGSALAITLSILVGTFAATGAAAALINALNKAYGVEEGRGFVSQRIAALVVVAALGVSLAGMFVAIVLGPTLIGWLVPDRFLDPPLVWLLTIGRYAAAVLILMGFFGFTFWYAPHRERHRLRFLTPGAVVGVVGWLALSWLFGLYVSFSRTYAETYGSVAGVIVMLVWLNYSFTLLLMAAELDHEIECHLDGRAAEDPVEEPDEDDVTEDMPRHPGLVAAGPAPSPEELGARTGGPRAPRPSLTGAAAKTAGAGVAAALWGRMGGRRAE